MLILPSLCFHCEEDYDIGVTRSADMFFIASV